MADFEACARDFNMPLREAFRYHRMYFDAFYGLPTTLAADGYRVRERSPSERVQSTGK